MSLPDRVPPGHPPTTPLGDAALIDILHEGLPLTDRPFADAAAAIGLTEDELIERLRALLATGVLSRFGPLFQIERAGGRFVLAAIAVPDDRFDAVAESVNARPEVAHNYRREHALNMWFVVAAESPEAADAVIAAIEVEVGLPVLPFPKEREYFVGLRLPLEDYPQAAASRPPPPDGVQSSGKATLTGQRPQASAMPPPSPEGIESSGKATLTRDDDDEAE